MKDEIVHYYDFGTGSFAKEKRGFNHPVCARLLLPAGLTYTEEYVYAILYYIELTDRIRIVEKYKNRVYNMGNQDFPTLLYKDEVYHPHDHTIGLLRNKICLRVK